MTREQFEQVKDIRRCRACSEQGIELYELETAGPHGAAIRCRTCKAFMEWLKKEKNKDKRPSVKRGTRDTVWKAWDNTCVHCGLHRDKLAKLGIGPTVQHVPPFKDSADEGWMLPYCEWCQQDSAARLKHLDAMFGRVFGGGRANG